jgi:hypothetical protein
MVVDPPVALDGSLDGPCDNGIGLLFKWKRQRIDGRPARPAATLLKRPF